MSLKQLALSLTVAAGLGTSLQAQAVFVQSTSAAAAGFTTTTTLTFTEVVLPDGSAVTTQYSAFGVSFEPNLYYNPQSCSAFNPNTVDPCLGNFGNGPLQDPWDIVFASAQTQAGFHMITNLGTSLFEAYLGSTLVDSGAAVTDSISLVNFFGFTGVTFDRIRVDTGGNNNSMLKDNLTFAFNATSVPEPGSLLLLALGLAGLGFLRRMQN